MATLRPWWHLRWERHLFQNSGESGTPPHPHPHPHAPLCPLVLLVDQHLVLPASVGAGLTVGSLGYKPREELLLYITGESLSLSHMRMWFYGSDSLCL